MYLCRQLTRRSFPEIARAFGKTDHTTALYGVRKIEQLIAIDDDLASDVQKIEEALKMEKVFLVILKNMIDKEIPYKFHEEIPASVRGDIVFGYRLGPDSVNLTCSELYERYQQAKVLGALPPSNLTNQDFFVRK
jgi:hypothetical protein